MAVGGWSVEFHRACEVWAEGLEQADAEALLAAIRVLRDVGPNLGRPLVDTVKGSRHSNIRSCGPVRQAEPRWSAVRVRPEAAGDLLLGGDKSDDWRGWYDASIPIADDRFDEHQAATEQQQTKPPGGGKGKGRR